MGEAKLTKKYPCIESTVDLNYGDITIRMWIDEDDLIPTDISSFLKNIKSFLYETGTKDRVEIINFIAKEIPRINAVQVLDHYFDNDEIRLGTVAYMVNFGEDDPHG